MKPYIIAAGSIYKAGAIVAGKEGKKPYVGWAMECPDPNSKYPARLHCVNYPRSGEDLNELAARFVEGSVMLVGGDVSASAYPDKEGKPKALLKVFVKSYEVVALGGGPKAAPAPPRPSPPPTQSRFGGAGAAAIAQQRAAASSQAPGPFTDEDDVPF